MGKKRTVSATLGARPRFEVTLGSDGAPPAEFRLFSVGVNETEKGPFLFDDVAAASVMSFWAGKGGVELSSDYEHQALEQPPVEAPASSWWTPEIRDGELWATNVRWTDRARSMLAAREYRYFSPAFEFDRDTRRVTRLYNFALTNIPAMDGIDALVAASATTKETDMDAEKLAAELTAIKAQLAARDAECEELKVKLSAFQDEKDEDATCGAIGLRAGAPRAERLTAIQKLATLRTEVCKLTGEANESAALGKLAAWQKDAADVATLRAEKDALETSTLTSDLSSVLDQATKDGKVAPAGRESLQLAILKMGGGKVSRDGVEWLKGHVSGLQVIVADKPTTPPTGSEGVPALSDAQLRVARTANVDPVAFAKWQAEKLSARK